MNHLGVFAKYWQPGTVKTRLAKTIGPVNAAGLYRDFVKLTLLRFSKTADTRSIWYWPQDRQGEFEQMASPMWQVHSQLPGDLGEKMRSYFKSTLAFHSRAVLIGSDTPNLPVHRVELALEMLDTSDVVIGPGEDGGYYLIGMRTDACDLFQDIQWSSSQVLDATIERAKTGGHSYRLLEPWRDIDTFDDLIWLHEHWPEPECQDHDAVEVQGQIVTAINVRKAEATECRATNRDSQ